MILRDWQLELTVDHVLHGQGADPAVLRQRRPQLVEIAAWALQEGLPLLEPQVLLRRLPVLGVRHERLLLEGGALNSPLLVENLAGAQEVVLMLCTLGNTLETLVAEMLPTDPVQGLALDGLGSAAIDALAAQASQQVEAQAREAGLQTSAPLSPGLLGWPVQAGQREIFQLLDAIQIGVSLTSSSMMQPAKSLTQVVGIGTHMAQGTRTCDFCSLNAVCRWQHEAHAAG